MDRKLHAVKEHLTVARHPDGGEILDVGELAELVRLVLDVEPAELDAGKLLLQGEKARSVLDAGIAPFGTKTGDDDRHA